MAKNPDSNALERRKTRRRRRGAHTSMKKRLAYIAGILGCFVLPVFLLWRLSSHRHLRDNCDLPSGQRTPAQFQPNLVSATAPLPSNSDALRSRMGQTAASLQPFTQSIPPKYQSHHMGESRLGHYPRSHTGMSDPLPRLPEAHSPSSGDQSWSERSAHKNCEHCTHRQEDAQKLYEDRQELEEQEEEARMEAESLECRFYAIAFCPRDHPTSESQRRAQLESMAKEIRLTKKKLRGIHEERERLRERRALLDDYAERALRMRARQDRNDLQRLQQQLRMLRDGRELGIQVLQDELNSFVAARVRYMQQRNASKDSGAGANSDDGETEEMREAALRMSNLQNMTGIRKKRGPPQ